MKCISRSVFKLTPSLKKYYESMQLRSTDLMRIIPSEASSSTSAEFSSRCRPNNNTNSANPQNSNEQFQEDPPLNIPDDVKSALPEVYHNGKYIPYNGLSEIQYWWLHRCVHEKIREVGFSDLIREREKGNEFVASLQVNMSDPGKETLTLTVRMVQQGTTPELALAPVHVPEPSTCKHQTGHQTNESKQDKFGESDQTKLDKKSKTGKTKMKNKADSAVSESATATPSTPPAPAPPQLRRPLHEPRWASWSPVLRRRMHYDKKCSSDLMITLHTNTNDMNKP